MYSVFVCVCGTDWHLLVLLVILISLNRIIYIYMYIIMYKNKILQNFSVIMMEFLSTSENASSEHVDRGKIKYEQLLLQFQIDDLFFCARWSSQWSSTLIRVHKRRGAEVEPIFFFPTGGGRLPRGPQVLAKHIRKRQNKNKNKQVGDRRRVWREPNHHVVSCVREPTI